MKKLFLSVVFVGAALFSGCQNTVNTVENSQRVMKPNTIPDKRFVTDGFLRDRLLQTGVVTAQTKDGLLQVQVSAMNNRVGFFSELWSGMTGENPYYVSYKFTWFDQNGMAVGNGVWLTKIIKPGETAFFDSVAPNKNCKDFILNLKEAQ